MHRVKMTWGDTYRIRAAELRARAQSESRPGMKAELENLALTFIRLAQQSEYNTQLDVSYATPPTNDGEPDVKC
jgi:hypothetical protein